MSTNKQNQLKVGDFVQLRNTSVCGTIEGTSHTSIATHRMRITISDDEDYPVGEECHVSLSRVIILESSTAPELATLPKTRVSTILSLM